MAAPSPDLPLQTPVPWNYTGPRLSPGDRCFLLGSCFSQALGTFLLHRGQAPLINPLGPVYNPHSMASQVESFLTGDMPDWERDLFQWRGLWRHPGAHTLLARESKPQALETLAREWTRGLKKFQEARCLILTFGTPSVWEEVSTAEIWTNCHTLPGNRFRRKTLTMDQILGRWTDLLTALHAKLVFTSLSPIRYLEAGPEHNSYSKALLRVVLEILKSLGTQYFPASEILLDQLRDYRWYDRDMIHPSPEAQEYIAGRFWSQVAGPELQKEGHLLLQFHRRLTHRPLQSQGKPRQAQELETLWQELKTQIPHLPESHTDQFPSQED